MTAERLTPEMRAAECVRIPAENYQWNKETAREPFAKLCPIDIEERIAGAIRAAELAACPEDCVPVPRELLERCLELVRGYLGEGKTTFALRDLLTPTPKEQ